MTKFHLNDKGEPGVCKAVKSCPFGDLTRDHYDSVSEARESFENRFGNSFVKLAPYDPEAPPRYHVALKSNFEKIMSKGLVPKIGVSSGKADEPEARVWLFKDNESLEDANWLVEEFDEEDECVVLEVRGVPHDGDLYEIGVDGLITPDRITLTDIEF